MKTYGVYSAEHFSYKKLIWTQFNRIKGNLSDHQRWCAATPLTALPKRTASAAVRAARYTADWACQCRAQASDRHPPAAYGSGAEVVEVHPPGMCCSKRPFSSHGRSRRPWSDFLQGYLTFCLGLAAAAAAAAAGGGDAHSESFYRCKMDLCAGPQSPQGSAGPGIILRRQSLSVIKRDKS